MRACMVLAVCLVAAGAARAQSSDPPKKPAAVTLARRGSDPGMASLADVPAGSIAMVPLTVPTGTPLQIALDHDVRVKKIGQRIRGHVMQPVYAFDKLVIPAGTEARGHIVYIKPISRKKRVLSLFTGNLTPGRKVTAEFDDLLLADGKHLPIDTTVEAGSGRALQFVTAGKQKSTIAKNEMGQEITQEKATQEVRTPAKRHRALRDVLAGLFIHRQYIGAGTVYFAELNQALGFGWEPLTATDSVDIGQAPPPGSSVHALLMTPLNSGITAKGSSVEALITQPLFDGGHRLVLPEGSRLKGEVVEVGAARQMHGNGELQLVFHEVVPPDGTAEEIAATFDGVQSAAGGRLQVNSEDGCTHFTARGQDVVFPRNTVMKINFGKVITPAPGSSSH